MSEIRELLELAALATGRTAADGWEYSCRGGQAENERMERAGGGYILDMWNPLTNDGDCARMCDQLLIDLEWVDNTAKASCAYYDIYDIREPFAIHGGDRGKARRLASTRVAYEIGKRIREAQG